MNAVGGILIYLKASQIKSLVDILLGNLLNIKKITMETFVFDTLIGSKKARGQPQSNIVTLTQVSCVVVLAKMSFEIYEIQDTQ